MSEVEKKRKKKKREKKTFKKAASSVLGRKYLGKLKLVLAVRV